MTTKTRVAYYSLLIALLIAFSITPLIAGDPHHNHESTTGPAGPQGEPGVAGISGIAGINSLGVKSYLDTESYWTDEEISEVFLKRIGQ